MQEELRIPLAGVTLDAVLRVPERPNGVVVFAHGAGSDRHSPRNLLSAECLYERGTASLLFDLLTAEEKTRYGTAVFDIEALTERLEAAVGWVRASERCGGLPIALLGASTGAAAALNVAARLGEGVAAVVSRGGRPDLAHADRLGAVTAPTLFIVGGDDTEVLEASMPPFDALRCEKRLDIVPGATHVFAEEGTLEKATELAVAWIESRMRPA